MAFFRRQVPLSYKKKTLLPQPLLEKGEKQFVKVFGSWEEEGLYFTFEIQTPSVDVSYPDYQKGDSIELFLDTRDRKDQNFVHRFVHHFVFFPFPNRDHYAKEVTRFRSDDMHPLCDPTLIDLTSQIKKEGYHLSVFLPAAILYGYDPMRFEKIGFNYRINTSMGMQQYFALTNDEYRLEQSPSLWASMVFEKKAKGRK